MLFPQESELERLKSARDAELKYLSEQNRMELEKAQEMSGIEITKFKEMVSAIGPQTLQSMATAGPDMQVRVQCSRTVADIQMAIFWRVG